MVLKQGAIDDVLDDRFTVVLYWMVLKQQHQRNTPPHRFYSSVILNGTETLLAGIDLFFAFYSSVILNGTETTDKHVIGEVEFYSSVILNGTETAN